jgi:hypothetical protein
MSFITGSEIILYNEINSSLLESFLETLIRKNENRS